MKHIDRLIIAAKKAAYKSAYKLIQGFIHYDPAKNIYIADGRLWTGKRGEYKISTCECATEQEAFEALDQLSEQYPNDEVVQIFYGELDQS